MSQPEINILVPLYNEAQVFDELVNRLQKLIDNSILNIEIIFVDDGSTDGTAFKVRELSLKNEKFQSILLSRNFGHQLALTAGLKYINASEAVLIIDADLQDPPELLEELYSHFKKGFDVVYAVRKKRKETFIKKIAYKWYYKLLKRISIVDIPLNSGDFALISLKIVKQLNKMPEESRYLRGMRSWIGYNQIGVEYERDKRHNGKSKYSIKKLIKLAFNGIFNFSEYPIKFITNLGLTIVITSVIYFVYVVMKRILHHGHVPQGFTALLFMIILFGGLQLLAIGLIGEYVIRIFFQVKNRPLYILKERIVYKEIIIED
jgi:dolichol-phosphate mannosyltransferase